jgi:hypothetical protein
MDASWVTWTGQPVNASTSAITFWTSSFGSMRWFVPQTVIFSKGDRCSVCSIEPEAHKFFPGFPTPTQGRSTGSVTLGWEARPPHTVTDLPSFVPCHRQVVHVLSSRFFHSSELRKTSSSGLNSSKIVREATRIIFRLARLNATVSRRGSSKNLLEASR